MSASESSLIVVGCIRNSGRLLPHLFRKLQKLECFFHEVRYVWVENDSNDDSKKHLALFESRAKGRCTVICLDGLCSLHPQRTARLAVCRNAYADAIKKMRNSGNSFVLVVDMDEVNSDFDAEQIVNNPLQVLINSKDVVAVFPNSIPNYYDLWALRHKDLCPDDIFWDLALLVAREGRFGSEQLEESLLSAVSGLKIAETDGNINVQSAFGGAGLYRSDCFIAGDFKYQGLDKRQLVTRSGASIQILAEVCEHVSFHDQIRELGRLTMIPSWVTRRNCFSEPLPSAFTGLYRFPADGSKVFSIQVDK
jgi:hypothetical protein